MTVSHKARNSVSGSDRVLSRRSALALPGAGVFRSLRRVQEAPGSSQTNTAGSTSGDALHYTNLPDGLQLHDDERRSSPPVQRHDVHDPEPTVRLLEAPTAAGRYSLSSTCQLVAQCQVLSSWSAARERAHVRKVRTRDSSTDMIHQKRMHRRP